MNIKLPVIFISFFFLAFLVPAGVKAATSSFEITVNSGSASPGEGNFACNSCTLPLSVNKGDTVSITFTVPANDPYCCGIQVKGNNGQFDTGTISKGSTKTVSFTAESSFTFTAYWPGTNTVKATANINVNVPLVPSSTPSPTTAPNMPTNTPQPALPTPTGLPSGSNLPAIPTGLLATAISSSQIELSWQAAVGATGYQVYRNGSMIKFVNTLFYSDSGLSPDTTYSYKILATNSFGSSGYTANVSAKTMAAGVAATPLISTTPVPGQTLIVSPAITKIPDDNIFVDDTQTYSSVNNEIYAFNYLPNIKPGDQFIIYGRTVALAEITVTVFSEPKNYSTVADADGFWHLAIDTSVLTDGDHTFTTLIKDGERAKQIAAVPFKVGTSNTAVQTTTSGNPLSYLLMGLGVLVILGGFALVYFKLIRTPKALQQVAGNQVKAFYGNPTSAAGKTAVIAQGTQTPPAVSANQNAAMPTAAQTAPATKANPFASAAPAAQASVVQTANIKQVPNTMQIPPVPQAVQNQNNNAVPSKQA